MATLTPEQQQDFAARRLALQNQTDVEKRRLQEDYDIGSRLAREQSDRDQYDVGNQIASQGLYNSGIRVNEQGQIVRRLNENLGQMELTRSRGMETAGMGYTRGIADIAAQEREALAEATRRETEEAIQREMLRAQQEAAIRAAIPPPPAVINYPQYIPAPAPAPPPNYSALFPQMRQMYIDPYGPMGTGIQKGSTGSTPYRPTGWNSGVGGQPKLTPIKPGSRF